MGGLSSITGLKVTKGERCWPGRRQRKGHVNSGNGAAWETEKGEKSLEEVDLVSMVEGDRCEVERKMKINLIRLCHHRGVRSKGTGGNHIHLRGRSDRDGKQEI